MDGTGASLDTEEHTGDLGSAEDSSSGWHGPPAALCGTGGALVVESGDIDDSQWHRDDGRHGGSGEPSLAIDFSFDTVLTSLSATSPAPIAVAEAHVAEAIRDHGINEGTGGDFGPLLMAQGGGSGDLLDPLSGALLVPSGSDDPGSTPSRPPPVGLEGPQIEQDETGGTPSLAESGLMRGDARLGIETGTAPISSASFSIEAEDVIRRGQRSVSQAGLGSPSEGLATNLDDPGGTLLSGGGDGGFSDASLDNYNNQASRTTLTTTAMSSLAGCSGGSGATGTTDFSNFSRNGLSSDVVDYIVEHSGFASFSESFTVSQVTPVQVGGELIGSGASATAIEIVDGAEVGAIQMIPSDVAAGDDLAFSDAPTSRIESAVGACEAFDAALVAASKVDVGNRVDRDFDYFANQGAANPEVPPFGSHVVPTQTASDFVSDKEEKFGSFASLAADAVAPSQSGSSLEVTNGDTPAVELFAAFESAPASLETSSVEFCAMSDLAVFPNVPPPASATSSHGFAAFDDLLGTASDTAVHSNSECIGKGDWAMTSETVTDAVAEASPVVASGFAAFDGIPIGSNALEAFGDAAASDAPSFLGSAASGGACVAQSTMGIGNCVNGDVDDDIANFAMAGPQERSTSVAVSNESRSDDGRHLNRDFENHAASPNVESSCSQAVQAQTKDDIVLDSDDGFGNFALVAPKQDTAASNEIGPADETIAAGGVIVESSAAVEGTSSLVEPASFDIPSTSDFRSSDDALPCASASSGGVIAAFDDAVAAASVSEVHMDSEFVGERVCATTFEAVPGTAAEARPNDPSGFTAFDDVVIGADPNWAGDLIAYSGAPPASGGSTSGGVEPSNAFAAVDNGDVWNDVISDVNDNFANFAPSAPGDVAKHDDDDFNNFTAGRQAAPSRPHKVPLQIIGDVASDEGDDFDNFPASAPKSDASAQGRNGTTADAGAPVARFQDALSPVELAFADPITKSGITAVADSPSSASARSGRAFAAFDDSLATSSVTAVQFNSDLNVGDAWATAFEAVEGAAVVESSTAPMDFATFDESEMKANALEALRPGGCALSNDHTASYNKAVEGFVASGDNFVAASNMDMQNDIDSDSNDDFANFPQAAPQKNSGFAVSEGAACDSDDFEPCTAASLEVASSCFQAVPAQNADEVASDGEEDFANIASSSKPDAATSSRNVSIIETADASNAIGEHFAAFDDVPTESFVSSAEANSVGIEAAAARTGRGVDSESDDTSEEFAFQASRATSDRVAALAVVEGDDGKDDDDDFENFRSTTPQVASSCSRDVPLQTRCADDDDEDDDFGNFSSASPKIAASSSRAAPTQSTGQNDDDEDWDFDVSATPAPALDPLSPDEFALRMKEILSTWCERARRCEQCSIFKFIDSLKDSVADDVAPDTVLWEDWLSQDAGMPDEARELFRSGVSESVVPTIPLEKLGVPARSAQPKSVVRDVFFENLAKHITLPPTKASQVASPPGSKGAEGGTACAGGGSSIGAFPSDVGGVPIVVSNRNPTAVAASLSDAGGLDMPSDADWALFGASAPNIGRSGGGGSCFGATSSPLPDSFDVFGALGDAPDPPFVAPSAGAAPFTAASRWPAKGRTMSGKVRAYLDSLPKLSHLYSSVVAAG